MVLLRWCLCGFPDLIAEVGRRRRIAPDGICVGRFGVYFETRSVWRIE